MTSRFSSRSLPPLRLALVATFAAMASHAAIAQSTPVGLWRVFDDDTKQPTSLVRIVDAAGTLSGRIEKLLDPAEQAATCQKCTDERKGQPLLGMVILRNVKAAGEQTWENGDILDPDNGKVYRVRLRPLEGGKQLEVRGYLGPFYRNQQWVRVE